MESMSAASPSRTALFEALRERPGLLAWELLWRWLCGALLLAMAALAGSRIWAQARPAVEATGVLSLSGDSLLEDPSRPFVAFSSALQVLRPQMEHAAAGLAPLGIFCWLVAFALGRTAVLARYDGRLPQRPSLLAACEGVRLLWLGAASLGWSVCLQGAAALALRGSEPNVLLYVCIALGSILLLALLWVKGARTLELLLMFALLKRLSFGEAFRRALQPLDSQLKAHLSRARRAAGRMRFLLVLAAFALGLLPSPGSGAMAEWLWWGALSLVLLGAAGAVRLALLFTCLELVRVSFALAEEPFSRVAAAHRSLEPRP